MAAPPAKCHKPDVQQLRNIPLIRPYTYAFHSGPGNERGQPYWPSGNQHWQIDYALEQDSQFHNVSDPTHPFPRDYVLNPDQRTMLSLAKNCPDVLYTYAAPDSHRSTGQGVTYNGATAMNSQSKTFKIGSKHCQDQIAQSPIKMWRAYLERQCRLGPENICARNGNVYDLRYKKRPDEWDERSTAADGLSTGRSSSFRRSFSVDRSGHNTGNSVLSARGRSHGGLWFGGNSSGRSGEAAQFSARRNGAVLDARQEAMMGRSAQSFFKRSASEGRR